MKKIVLTISLITLSIFTFSQSNCNNLDFEDGSLNNWVLTTGNACNSSYACYTNPSIAFTSSRHILYNTGGTDPDALLVELVCPFTNSNSVKLGNEASGLEAEEMIRQYQLGVTDTVLKFHYAYVTNEAGHGGNNNPFFLVEILDSLGSPFVPAIDFYMESSDVSLDTIASSPFSYKDWTTINFDVSAISGEKVKIRVLNSDCAYGGHEGRVYFDFECMGNTTSINDIIESKFFNIYPNPTKSNINFNTVDKGKVYFYSVNGKLMDTYNVSNDNSVFELNYTPGIYFVKFVSEKGDMKTQKIQIID